MDVGTNSSRVVQDEVLIIDTGGSSLSCVEVLIQILCKMCSCSTGSTLFEAKYAEAVFISTEDLSYSTHKFAEFLNTLMASLLAPGPKNLLGLLHGQLPN
jgi:hypothetical protein